jgi:hypothetical protein
VDAGSGPHEGDQVGGGYAICPVVGVHDVRMIGGRTDGSCRGDLFALDQDARGMGV